MTEHRSSERLARPPILVAPGVYDAFTALVAEQAGFEALYLSGAGDRLHAARAARHRPRQHERSRRRPSSLIRDRVDGAADRRRRHRLRQRAQRRAHGADVRARRRHCDPDRGSGFSQALRPSRRQDADSGARNGRQDPRGGRCAPSRETLIIARTDAVAVEGFDRAIGAGRTVSSRPAPTCCSSRRRSTRDELSRIGRALRQIGAADGQHGRGRQDADPVCGRTRGARLRARHFPRRHRARARAGRAKTFTAR